MLNGFSGGDLIKELQQFREELMFADLEIITNRVNKLQDQLKKPRPAKEKDLDQSELSLLQRIVAAFEQGQRASTLGLKPDEEKISRSFQLLTLKPEFILVNTGDEQSDKALPAALSAEAPAAASAVKLELELADLSEEDRAAFMSDMGLKQFTRDVRLREIYSAMGLMVFFTVGEDECRAWGLKRGEDAVEETAQIPYRHRQGFRAGRGCRL